MVKTTINLYRALRNGTLDGPLVTNDQPQVGLLYPRWDKDVTVSVGDTEPIVETGGGTSLHDVEGWFGFADWRYFCIPAETPLPASLVLKKGKKTRTNKTGDLRGFHYQIEPQNPMTVDALKGALDNLARAAVVRQVELANA